MVTKQTVALKKIKLFEMTDAKARSDCMKEIGLLQQLDHPNIIRYLSSFIDNNELHIVLELADAGDLQRMIKHFHNKGRPIPEKTVWKYFVQICHAVEYMHSKRIMHRDIKPANVFITAGAVVKLGDLGLGRYFSTCTTQLKTLVGTPYYMSPERIREHNYDFKSDVWSVGCLLYELAALQSPFFATDMTLKALCTKIESCSYPPLPQHLYSSTLCQLVDRCLTSDPAERPSASLLVHLSADMKRRTEGADSAVSTCSYSSQSGGNEKGGRRDYPGRSGERKINTAVRY